MENLFLPFQELSVNQLYDILKLRQDIFIIEQDCIYSDLDDYDKKAVHHILLEDNHIIGYSRIFKPGIKYKAAASIGRIIVHPKFRGNGNGELLIKNSILYCEKNFPKVDIKIEAQAALEQYYNLLGFTAEGEVYPIDGIPHIEMIYSIKN